MEHGARVPSARPPYFGPALQVFFPASSLHFPYKTKDLTITVNAVLKHLFHSLWKDFKSRFNHLISDLQQQKSNLESHVNQIHIQRYELDRVKMLQEFEEAQAKRAVDKYLFVQGWIRAESCTEHHEDNVLVRQEQQTATGQQPGVWILDNEYVRAWLMPGVPRASFLWITAIPGAGEMPQTLFDVDKALIPPR